MKINLKNLLALIVCTCIVNVYGQESTAIRTIETKLTEVTVSLNGATLRREANVNLNQGTNIIKITGLSSSLDESSLQIGLENNEAKIVSISSMKDFITDTKRTKKSLALSDSLELFMDKLTVLNLDSDAIAIEKELLTQNITRIGKDGVSVSELQVTLPYYRTQLKTVHEKMLQNQYQQNQVLKTISKIKSQLIEIQADKKSNAQTVLVTINAKTALQSKLLLTYVSSQATWLPQYDIRTQGAGSPIVFDYKARVINKTGEDWEKVILKLTTADPSKLMEKPSLEVWGLNYDKYGNDKSEGQLNNYQMRNDYSNKNNADSDESKASTQVEVNEVSVEFAIKDIATIESDGIPQLMDVNVFEFPATYQYYCVPKLDKDVYLMGMITDWESMNLIEGIANVYVDNIFAGKSVIDIKSANDTLQLFLGIDKKVQVNRVKKKDESSKKTIGTNKKESFIYHINVRNSNKVPIAIEVVDQVPLSQDTDIEVTVDQISGAEQDIPSGKLVWHLNVAPSETQKLVIEFSVKYSRNKKINIRQTRRVMCPKFRY